MTSKGQTDSVARPAKRGYLRAVGPGLITAAVVIGPGSILTSSKVGAGFGFQMIWVLVVAVAFMMVYTMLGAKLGVVSGRSAGDLVTERAGRWLAAVIGIGVFFISASFQFGNNMGVHSAVEVYVDFDYAIVFFNALAIAFMFAFKDLYRVVERLMATFVGLMLLSFVVNLLFAKPKITEMLMGLVPRMPTGAGGKVEYIAVLGMVATTFVISAAYYQSYLVQQKGWKRSELRNGLIDARVASLILGLITLMIMSTSAAMLRGRELTNVGDVARQLEPLFGTWGQALFCVGLFCAAYSSFIVNSMIGGFMLSDGLGLGSKPQDIWPRIFSAMVLLTGMVIALFMIKRDWNPVPAIVFAQAVTVLAAPLMAGSILWLTNRKDVMGKDRNGPAINIAAGLGFVMLVAIAINVAVNNVLPKIWPRSGQNPKPVGVVEASMKREFIFEAPLFGECHASTIVELEGGQFLTAWFGGTDEGSDDTEIWGSRLVGGQWSKPAELAAEKGAACWNPVLFKERGGRVWLFYKVGKSVPQWTGAYRISEDDGKSWGPITYMPSGLLGPIRCKPLELEDGTLVCGSSVESYRSWTCWVERIADGGKRWERVGPICLPEKRLGLIQPTIWSVKGEHLRMFMRSHQPIDRICRSDSMDNGWSWSPASVTDLPNNNAGVDAVKLTDGRLVLVYNHTTRKDPREGRHRIHLNVSTDSGQTWGPPYLLEDKGKEYSYPAVIQAADGTVHITYTWNRKKIRHVTIPPDELQSLVPHK